MRVTRQGMKNQNSVVFIFIQFAVSLIAQIHAVKRPAAIQKKRFGKNAILKGMNLQEGATAKDRNAQVGGHKA